MHALILFLFSGMTFYYVFNLPDRKELDQIFRIILCVAQIGMWVLSSIMMLFEYRRALGHVWYVHPLYWWFSLIAYAADVTLWNTDKEHKKSESDTNLVAAFIFACAISLYLGVMAIVFPNDVPYERRNYMESSDQNAKLLTGARESLTSSHRSGTFNRTSQIENIETKKPLPIITAKVTA